MVESLLFYNNEEFMLVDEGFSLFDELKVRIVEVLLFFL